MATVVLPLSLKDALPLPGSVANVPYLDVSSGAGSGASNIGGAFPIYSLVFGKGGNSVTTATNGVHWLVSTGSGLFGDQTTPNVKLSFTLYAPLPSDSSLQTVFFAQMASLDTGTTPLLGKSLAAVTGVTTVINTFNKTQTSTITFANQDGLTTPPTPRAGTIVVKLWRHGVNVQDTAQGDIRIVAVTLTYNDT
jgi:hypothetical protein